MPACQRAATFHSKEQRLYSQQAQAMLTRTPEFKQFQRTVDQTEELRLSWILGLLFFIILIYADVVVFITEQGDGRGLLGGFLRLKAFPPILNSLLAIGFLLYPVGWILLAPWFGIHGPVEYTRIKAVILGHVMTAALFSLAMDMKVGTILEERRLPTLADTHPLTLRAFLPTFIGGLVPVVTGLAMRWWLCSGSWRKRTVTNLPHLWLPPLHFMITVPLMFALTVALRRLMTDSTQVSPKTLGSNLDLIVAETSKVLVTMGKNSNIRTWTSRAGSLAINNYLSFSASYLLLLISTQLEIYLFSPILRRILLPSGHRTLAMYVSGLAILALHYWRAEHVDRPLIFYMVVSYMVVLLLRGGRSSEESDDSHDPEDDPK